MDTRRLPISPRDRLTSDGSLRALEEDLRLIPADFLVDEEGEPQ